VAWSAGPVPAVNDRIYGDRETSLAALYDPTTAPSGLPGDWSSGGTGDDEVYGGAGDDVLMGGSGEDLLVGGAGMDVLLGDDHFYLRPNASFWAVVHPNFGEANLGAFEVGLFPVVNLLDAPDTIFALTGDRLFTYYKDGGAADVLIGGAGKDLLIGQAGDDTLYGGEDEDILAGWEGDDRIIGGAGDDLIAGEFGRDEQPNQRVGGATQLVRPGTVGSLVAASSAVDQTGDDFLEGGAGKDQIWGEGGADQVFGGEGDDTLYGDAPYLPNELHGADVVDGGAGDDVLHGGGGADVLSGGTGADTMSGDDGNDLLRGGAGDDRLSGGNDDDVLNGDAGADVLAGDAGADSLYGGEGNDELDGGSGNDLLDGGRGDDILAGGDDDDVLDGRTGSDVLRGGAGNDTYVLSLGYGADRIDDSEGVTSIRFGDGIAAGALSATLDAGTLTATVAYGFAGDTVTLNVEETDVGAVSFADGTSWGAEQLIALIPALVSSGSAQGDLLVGHEKLRNDLHGLEGDDLLLGSGNDDTLAGGDGADHADGGSGSDRYLFDINEAGIDPISDSGISARAYLEKFYADLGIADWEERGLFGGRYRAEYHGEEGLISDYFETLEEALEAVPFAEIAFVDPLPEIAPLVTRDSAASLEALIQAGVLDRDVVAFGPGLHIADLGLTIAVDRRSAAEHPDRPWQGGGTLSVRWGNAGFDVDVPDVGYGFEGDDLFADGVPDEDDDFGPAWRGYRLGEGIEAFEFADGAMYSLEEILERATVVEKGYSFQRDSGSQEISADHWSSITFGPGIGVSEVSAQREGDDFVFQLSDGSAEGRIVGWYADPDATPAMAFVFVDGTVLDADSVTRLGLTQIGTDGPEVLEGDADFASALHGLGGRDILEGGAGNDLFDGGPGKDFMTGMPGNDIYVYRLGYGEDTIDEHPEDDGFGLDTVRFGEAIAPESVSIGQDFGDLVLTMGSEDDVLTLVGWLDVPGGTVERFEFADGTVWDAGTIAPLLPQPDEATDEDDALYGAFGDDVLDGLGGDDEIAGFAGDDSLSGGDGDDYLEGGSGNDILRGGAGADDLEEFGPGNNLIDAGAGDDYVFEDGHTLVVGGAGGDWIDNYGAESVILFNPGDGNDTLYAADGFTLSLGGGLTPADLALSADGDDLVLQIGESESIRFTREFESDPRDWPTITLQMFGSVHGYDFNALIDLLAAASEEDPSITLPLDGVLQAYETRFSESEALGGAVAWRYAMEGTLDGLADSDISAILSDDAFGSPQPIPAETANRAPVLREAIADAATSEDAPFVLAVPADSFADADIEDVLTYEARLANGDALPAWLSFDTATRVFSGTPANEDVGVLSIALSATDSAGASATDTFEIRVLNVNDDPAAEPDTALAFEDGGPVMISGATLLANDRDPDVPETLSIIGVTGSSAGARTRLVNGDVEYDPGARFQELGQGATAVYSFAYTVAALSGAGSSATVRISFVGVNDATLAEEDALSASEHEIVSRAGNVLSNDSDVDAGSTLTVANAGTLSGLYGTLTLASDGAYTYTLANSSQAVQSLREGQQAVDVFGYRASDGLTSSEALLIVEIAGANDAPQVAEAVPGQAGNEGSLFAFSVPLGAFDDVDAQDTMALSASLADGSALPAWLSFDASSARFNGTPGLADGGDYAIRLVATDASGASASEDFSLTMADSLAHGDAIDGTPGDDVLNGTSANERLAGGRGTDRLLGGGGDDVLSFYADERWKGPWRALNVGSPDADGTGEAHPLAGKNRSLDIFDGGEGFDTLLGTDGADAVILDDRGSDDDGARVQGIEHIDARGGRDIVDLTSRRFAYSDVMVDGGTEDDVLWTSSGNDLLIGGRGNDELAGGAGDDVYLYRRGDGHDVVRDVQGADTLAFGEGISQSDVGLERRHRDLVVRVGRSGGSVTIADWFAAGAKHLEHIQFLDGSVWDAAGIEERLERHGRVDTHVPWLPPNARRHDEPIWAHDMPVPPPLDRGPLASIASLIAGYLGKAFSLGEAPAREREATLEDASASIARQWALVHRFAQSLTYEIDDDLSRSAPAGWQPTEAWTSASANNGTGFGFDASLGRVAPPGGFQTFAGLDEGFRRL
jgi:VCBS repeat-containing protein